jgi:hypothetical protein
VKEVTYRRGGGENSIGSAEVTSAMRRHLLASG